MSKLQKLLLIPIVLITFFVGTIATLNILFRSDTSENTTPPANQSDVNEGLLKGFALSPKSYESKDFSNFFDIASNGNLISWHGFVSELSDKTKAPFVVTKLAKTYGVESLIVVDIYKKEANFVLDEATRDLYTSYILDYVSEYKPKYIGIGNEVNILYDVNRDNFNKFVDYFPELARKIKAISPDTKVFTIFQLEMLKGLKGGLFGGINDTSTNKWELIALFRDSDVVGFTTYPTLVFSSPDEIPVNYYSEISSYVEKPIVFTEIGWLGSNNITGFESSQDEQIAFIKKFFNLIDKDKTKIVVWPFLFQMKNAPKPFDNLYMLEGIEDTNALFEFFLSL